MTVVVNGTSRSYAAGTTIAAVVADIAQDRSGVAVAVNGEVVRRGEWSSTPLRESDRVEVLTAVQGG